MIKFWKTNNVLESFFYSYDEGGCFPCPIDLQADSRTKTKQKLRNNMSKLNI